MRNSLFAFLLLVICSNSAIAQRRDSVVLKTATGTIYGTLTIPVKPKSAVPVVIIIAGSGPTDRNGNSGIMTNNSLRILSDSLAKYGIASLRYDKRGIGSSKAAAPNESKLKFADYVKDVNSWIGKLGKDRRFSKIFVAGHAEGSLVGMLAARQTPVAGFISLAGAGRPADEMVLDQLRAGQMSKPMLDSAIDFFTQLKTNGRIKQVPAGFFQSLFRPSVQSYVLSWIRFNPATELAGLTAPALIIQGNTDLQVDTLQAQLLVSAKPDAQLLIIPNMNHVFRDVPADDRGLNIATYYDPALPIKSELVQGLVRFIKENSQPKN